MQTVEINVIRELAREIYTGADYEGYLKKGYFARRNFPKQVSEALKRKLGEEHTDRIYTGRNINKHLVERVEGLLVKCPKKTAISVEYTMKSNKRPRNDPIIDYDSDVSSSGEMDQSTLMDSMNDSQVSTRSTCCRYSIWLFFIFFGRGRAGGGRGFGAFRIFCCVIQALF